MSRPLANFLVPAPPVGQQRFLACFKSVARSLEFSDGRFERPDVIQQRGFFLGRHVLGTQNMVVTGLFAAKGKSANTPDASRSDSIPASCHIGTTVKKNANPQT
jgi:hypothetical protein